MYKTIKRILRQTALPFYNFATPYLNPEHPFPNNSTYVGSYSSHKEDLIIDAIFGCKEKGTYIDIGANDPVYHSNTKRFYQRGWRGINVEPVPRKWRELQNDRPEDINLNMAVSDKDTTMPFYVLDWEMASSLDKEAAQVYAKLHNTYIKEVIQIPVCRLDTIIKTHLPGKQIDFVSIDVEEQVMPVLEGNDWDKYRPTLLCIEIWYDYEKRVREFIISKGYVPIFFTTFNGFFIDKEKVYADD